jgi:G3E family GTPase
VTLEKGTKRRPVQTKLIGGFLGAGKTTLITELLQRTGKRVAVLVNEFGRLGMDGEIIRLGGGIEVVELPGGCICCSQREGVVASIHRIAEEIAPELLLIEPSGVAEISELLQVLTDRSLAGVIDLSAVVTVLDASTFLEFSEPEAFGLFFLDQVRCADLILINKCDLVTAETLGGIEARIAEHNPEAVTLSTRFCRVDGPLPQFCHHPRKWRQRPEPLDLDCVSVIPPRAFSQKELERFLSDLSRGSFGRIMRGKGFLEVEGWGWLNLQVVSGKAEVKRLPDSVAPRLILIGFGLKSQKVRSFFRGVAA